MSGFPTGEWTHDGGIYAGHETHEVVDWAYEDTAEHVARWDPARVLAECEAKRQMAQEFLDLFASVPGLEDPEREYLADRLLRRLAQPYADHPDYREEGRP